MIRVAIDGAVAAVVLDHAPVNAIRTEWLVRFNAEVDQLQSRSDWHVLHIRSEQKVFCAGADLQEVRQRFAAADGAQATFAFVDAIQGLFSRIEAMPQVSIAEIGGAAMGGGLELALACDLRVAAVEARLGLPEARLGLLPGGGGTQRLTRLCGRSVATRLILGAEIVDGRTAAMLGIVHSAVARAELADHTRELVARVAALPAPALAACKACIAAAAEPGPRGFGLERDYTRSLFMDAGTRQRVSDFFDGVPH